MPKNIIQEFDNNEESDYLNDDLKIMRWALNMGVDAQTGFQKLAVNLDVKPVAMAHSTATGEGLVSTGLLGGDLIRLEAGEGFVPHTHPGDHLLIVVGGEGTITYGGKIYPTSAGEVYMVKGGIPHAVGAITDHVIFAVGAPHKPVDSTERMVPVEYEALATRIDLIHCLICDRKAVYPALLHQKECQHCPCPECLVLPKNCGNQAN